MDPSENNFILAIYMNVESLTVRGKRNLGVADQIFSRASAVDDLFRD